MDRILDLFCGAGGFSQGFRMARKDDHFIGVDIWDKALKTYRENIQGETILKSVQEFDPSTVGKIDILIGSPPCQQFSHANQRRTLDMSLVHRFLEIRDYLKPKFWVMEEVATVGRIAKKEGLFVPRYQHAYNFGLPHRRKRLFAGNYPEPDKIDCRGQFSTLVKTPIAHIRGFYHGRLDKKRSISDIQELLRGSLPDFITSQDILRSPDVAFCKLVTPEYYAWVMGFPADYHFHGNKIEVFIQIGNAVCPPIAKAIRLAILNKPRLF